MKSKKFLQKQKRSVQTFVLELIVVVACRAFISESASNELLNPANTKCACSGDVLTYNCTVMGNGSTLWEGSALDCTIFLRHNRFDQPGGVDGACNNGDIIGKSLRVEDNCYTSQLNVTVSHGLNNKTIACILSSDDGLTNIGHSTLKVIQAPFPPPQNVQLDDIQQGKLSFTWNSLDQNCETIDYYPTFNCGICPNVSTSTRTSCSYFQLSTDTRMCNFIVHGVRCVSQAENPASNSIMVILKLPDAPKAKVTPVYSNDSGKLTKLLAEINHQSISYVIANGISGNVTHYKIYWWSSSEILFNSTISTSHCMSGICEVSTNIEEYICSATVAINVTFSAGNILGLGPSLNPIRIDCSNQLVTIKYDLTSSTISCHFFDESTERKSCYIQHGLCTEKIDQYTGSNITSSSMILSFKLNISDRSHEYCYRVTASNSSRTVVIEGQIDFDNNATNGDPPLIAIIVPVLIAVICISVVLTLISVIYYYCYTRQKTGKFKVVTEQTESPHKSNESIADTCVDEQPLQNTRIPEKSVDKESCAEASVYVAHDQKSKSEPSANDISQLNLKPIDQLHERLFIKFDIHDDCDLEGFFNGLLGMTLKRGNTFCEFLGKENVSEEKQLIFMSKGKNEYFFPDVDKDVLHKKGLLGEGRTVPKWIKGYRVFVQSTGLRARYLPTGSAILYEESAPLPFHQLICIPDGQFEETKVNQIKSADCSRVFIELNDCIVATDITDVILMNQKTKQKYTGRFAFDMVEKHVDNISKIEAKLWKAFICGKYNIKSGKGKNLEALFQNHPPVQLLQRNNLHPGRSPFICIDQRQFTIVKIEKSCHLKQFRKMHNFEGDHHIYLKVSDENSASIKNVILIDEETNEFYTCRYWDASGVDLKQSRIVLYKIVDDDEFKLSRGASILFQEGQKLNLSKKMIPLYTKHFHECKYSDLQESQTNKGNIFVKLDCCPKGVTVLDVILRDTQAGEKLFSGPCARQMVEYHLLGIQQIDPKKWDVFVLTKKSFKFPEDSPVLCQDPEYICEEYHILIVRNDVIKMSSFIETELEHEVFVNGRAFYEFTKEEDLLGYKEVVHVPNKLIEHRVENLYTLKSDTTYFYNISGTPGLSVKPPIMPQTRMFLQSTSQGARCLKKGMVILYKADVTLESDDKHKAAIQLK